MRRRTWLIGAAALAAGLGGCRRAEPAPPLRWQPALPGLEIARAQSRAPGDRLPAAVHLLRVQLAAYELRVVRAVDLGQNLASAEDFRRHAGAVAAINAGYFDPQYRPLGLLVSAGRELAHLRRVDHGVFAVAAGQAFLEHARAWQAPPDLEFAVECGPRLLVDGQVQQFRSGELARRVAIGRDRPGRVVLAVSEGVLSLGEWAATLGRPEAEGGAALVEALNLDGGSSAMLDVAAGAVQLQVTTAVRVPVGLAVVRRAAARTTAGEAPAGAAPADEPGVGAAGPAR